MRVGMIASDARQRALGDAFARRGIEVVWLRLGGEIPKLVVFPMPISEDGVYVYRSTDTLVDWFEALRGRAVFGGRCSENVHSLAGQYGIRILDHFCREEEVILNVIPTVEGALELAMRETPFTLHGSSALVVGFGRIGKLLAEKLKALGVRVTVSARKSQDFAWCKVWGYEYIHTDDIAAHLQDKMLIFNTVPYMLFDSGTLARMESDTLLVDLASLPGGVDFAAAKLMGRRALQALGLPAKVAPRTAGEIICETILGMYKEENTRA